MKISFAQDFICAIPADDSSRFTRVISCGDSFSFIKSTSSPLAQLVALIHYTVDCVLLGIFINLTRFLSDKGSICSVSCSEKLHRLNQLILFEMISKICYPFR